MTSPTPLTSLRVGDVITYRIPVEDRRIVTHRIVEISGPKANPIVVTKGDANNVRDAWEAQLQGSQAWTYRGRIPKAGYLLHSVRGRIMQVMSLGALALFAVLTLWQIWAPGPSVDEASTDEGDDAAFEAADELDAA